MLVSSSGNQFNCLFLTVMFQAAENHAANRNTAETFPHLGSRIFWFFSSRFLWERKSPRPSVRRTMAGRNGTHFAHHSSCTTHSQSSSRVLWNRPVSIVSGEGGGWGGGVLLLSDKSEYNMWFRGKVLLYLPTSAKSLAFSRIFTNNVLGCETGPAKAKDDFLWPREKELIVVCLLSCRLRTLPFSVLSHTISHRLWSVGGFSSRQHRKCCGLAHRPQRFPSSATPFSKDLQLWKNHTEKLSDGLTFRICPVLRLVAFSSDNWESREHCLNPVLFVASFFLPHCWETTFRLCFCVCVSVYKNLNVHNALQCRRFVLPFLFLRTHGLCFEVNGTDLEEVLIDARAFNVPITPHLFEPAPVSKLIPFVCLFAHATVMQHQGGEYIPAQSSTGRWTPFSGPAVPLLVLFKWQFVKHGRLLARLLRLAPLLPFPPSLLPCLPLYFLSASLVSHPRHSFINIPPVHAWPAALLFYLIYSFNWKRDCYSTYLAPEFYFLFASHCLSHPPPH